MSQSSPDAPVAALLLDRYRQVRARTASLCESLEPEDFIIQSMPDVSPTRWHLAHMTWFFETFVVQRAWPDATPYHPSYNYLFNSYYNTVGEQFPRPQRGLLSRPTVREVFAYRRAIDERVERLLTQDVDRFTADLAFRIDLGLQHEQQHQELLLTDIKHVLSCNPLLPAFRPPRDDAPATAPTPAAWHEFAGGLLEFGHPGGGFAYDNEKPRHRAYVEPFALADRPVTNGEFLEFITDDGYERPELWLSDGWAHRATHGWRAPLYWRHEDGGWWEFTLAGRAELNPAAPLCHISYYEADAYANWAAVRLPTEYEWELAAAAAPLCGNFVESQAFHPQPAPAHPTDQLRQLFGDVWEWTASPYVAYPGYQAPAGAFGEYNGKFMCNQFVLRGGSCASAHSHLRPTYRNFFHPPSRWQFSGVRLARSL
jgi:ergothioneine biosynthesis protein EgtB